MKSQKIIIAFTLVLSFFSCQKDNEPNGSISTSCSPNSGHFSVTVDSEDYEMIIDTNSHFTIVYNYDYYDPMKTDFVVYSKNQNGGQLNVEAGLPGRLNVGTTNFTNDELDFDFFMIYADTFSLYVSEVTFNVTESVPGEAGVFYEPIAGTFSGTAHSLPWYNGQDPWDTVSFNGSFCLNGAIIP